MTSAQTLRDRIAAMKVFEPDSPKIAEYRAELRELNAEAKERKAARKAILDGILTATHVRLADGWAEVANIDAPKHEVIVQIGENRPERVPLSKILEVASL